MIPLAELIATPDRFRAWLQAQPVQGPPVGIRASHCGCPIARWLLSERPDAKSVSVLPSEEAIILFSEGAEAQWSDAEIERAEPSEWLSRFVAEADAKPWLGGISRDIALSILDEVSPP